MRGAKIGDLTGCRFDRLTVEKMLPSENGFAMCECVCDCGGRKIVKATHLKTGNVRSCGCLRRETNIAKCIKNHGSLKYGVKTHGDRLYTIWCNMKNRCSNKRTPDYKDYGARSVTICAEWINDFQAFRSWALSHGYRDDLTIDRIDVDGDYSPDNCRWATQIEQANNRRNNTRLTVDGVTKTIAEWEIATGIKQNTISCRLRRGWTAAQAVRK